jgi:hypothetical protein
MSELHVVFGAGPVGRSVREELGALVPYLWRLP